MAPAAVIRRAPPADRTPLLRDPAALRRVAETDGCLFFRGLVPAETVLALRRRVLAICGRFGWLDEAAPVEAGIVRAGFRGLPYDHPDFVRLQCEVLVLPEFDAIRGHEAVRRALSGILGGPFRAERGDTCRVFAPAAGEFTTPPHQDHHYVGGSEDIFTAWFPLGDCPADLGPIVALPGSHRGGIRPHTGEGAGRPGVALSGEEVFAGGDMRAGDACLFHSLAVHCALPNRTPDRLRLSMDCRYEPG